MAKCASENIRFFPLQRPHHDLDSLFVQLFHTACLFETHSIYRKLGLGLGRSVLQDMDQDDSHDDETYDLARFCVWSLSRGKMDLLNDVVCYVDQARSKGTDLRSSISKFF